MIAQEVTRMLGLAASVIATIVNGFCDESKIWLLRTIVDRGLRSSVAGAMCNACAGWCWRR